MNYEYKNGTAHIKRYDKYPRGANVPDMINEYECFCGKGKIVHHRTPGFDDDFAEIKCRSCSKKYRYLERCGDGWNVYI